MCGARPSHSMRVMRRATAVLIAAVTTLLLAGVAAPSGTASERKAAPTAATGRILVTPRREALVTRLPVRVVVRVPPRTTRWRVRVGRRDVTARFRRGRGSLRVARLGRLNGLRYGHNHLFVRAERSGRRPVIEARTFVLARRTRGIVRVRVRRGPVTSVSVRVAVPTLAPEHFGQPRELARRLSAIRRQRRIRVWLNGRPVTRADDRLHLTRWTSALSAAHGLRYGANRLRVQVLEPRTGRYALLRRRFVVSRTRHLAAAGWDVATRVRGHVRLDGRPSRTTRGGRPLYRWRILSKPRGSRAQLRRVRAARPLLMPDRRGRYVVGLTVSAGNRGASTDRVAVTAGPSSLLVPFKGLTVVDGRSGIKVGDTPYPNTCGENHFQWLTLDRASLTPTSGGGSIPDGGNSCFSSSGDDKHGLDALTRALKDGGTDQLVILAWPGQGTATPPFSSGQVDQFNSALNLLGAGPIEASRLTEGNQQLVVMGVPYSGTPGGDSGGGWYSQIFNQPPRDVLTGWLMPDSVVTRKSSPRYAFQPEKPTFDTSASHTPTTNTMTVRDQRVDATLPEGASGGFQVVKIDPLTFRVQDHAVFETNTKTFNGEGDPLHGRRAMAQFLNQSVGAREHVAVQSIGNVGNFCWPGCEQMGDDDQTKQAMAEAWYDLEQALSALGANPHTWNTTTPAGGDGPYGTYAFIGGPRLERSEAIESSTAVAKGESGTIDGRASVGGDGVFAPEAADPGDSEHSAEMYDLVFGQPAQPWPCPKPKSTDGGCNDALAYISNNLLEFNDWGDDLRTAYTGSLNLDYTAATLQLSELTYPSDERTCAQGRGRDVRQPPSFSRQQFCALVAQLNNEFAWLRKIQTMFNGWQQGLYRASGGEQVDVHSIGTDIKGAIDVPIDPTYEILVDIGEFFLLVAEDVALFGDTVTPLGWVEAVAAVYQIVTSLISDTDTHKPVGDQVQTKVDDLSNEMANRLSEAANGLDVLQQVMVSDYGRLQALGNVAGTPDWVVSANAMADHLTKAARTYFYSQLMPVPYGVHALEPAGLPPGSTEPDACRDALYGHTWRDAPPTAQLKWMGDFNQDGVRGGYPSQFVLGRYDLSIRYYAYPPAKLTDPMFLSRRQNGLGMQLHRFVWTQFDHVRPHSPPTNIAYCH
jgi:hypothetical protein